MLQVQPLTQDQMAQMLPVLQQVDPTATMPLMLRLITDSGTGRDTGVVAVADPNRMFRGGFAWEVEPGTDGARVLVVHHLAIPPLGQTRVAGLIATAMESLVQTQRCATARIELPTDSDWEADYFAGRGYAVVGLPSLATH